MTDPRYPIGPLELRAPLTAVGRQELMEQLREAPALFRAAVQGLTDAQLDTPYREGGWTVRQVAHHVPDSHMNGYIRFRWALTEDEPAIKPYDQAAWAELGDARAMPIEPSLALLDAIHARWLALLDGLEPEAFARSYVHPEDGPTTLDTALQIYAWHGRHHTAHITSLRERLGW